MTLHLPASGRPAWRRTSLTLAVSLGLLLAAGASTLPGPAVAASSAPAATKTYSAIVVNGQYPTSNSISLVVGHGSSWSAVKTITLGSGNLGLLTVSVAPNGKTAYVGVGETSRIIPIALPSFTRGKSFSSGVEVPFSTQVTANNRVLLSVGISNDRFAAVGLGNTHTVQHVKVGTAPYGFALLHNGAAAYVENSKSNTVSVVRVKGRLKLLHTIALPAACTDPTYAAASPNDRFVYVGCSATYRLVKVNVARNTVVAGWKVRIPKGAGPQFGGVHEIAISHNGKIAYVANGNDVYPVNLATRHVFPGIHMTGAYPVSISADGAYLLTAESDNGCGCSTDKVEAISLASRKVVSTFAAGGFEHLSVSFIP
jgi:DNA-binding beta-propeller fold protein YncE